MHMSKKYEANRFLNHLDSKVLHRIIRSWYTGRRWVGCYIWNSEEGTGRAAAPPRLLLTVSNVTAHPSTASVPITVLLYDGSLLFGFNVAIKGLIQISMTLSDCTTETRHLTPYSFFLELAV